MVMIPKQLAGSQACDPARREGERSASGGCLLPYPNQRGWNGFEPEHIGFRRCRSGTCIRRKIGVNSQQNYLAEWEIGEPLYTDVFAAVYLVAFEI
jgi:hypothetical protein